MTYKINIQEGTDSTLIVPNDLSADTDQALIPFDTEREKILVRGNVKEEDTDMIQLYTNLDCQQIWAYKKILKQITHKSSQMQ